MRHIQKDPLQLTPLKPERLAYHWDHIIENKKAFDDYTPLEHSEFISIIDSPRVLSWEIGAGVGLCSLVFLSPENPVIQMVMYDYIYRIYLASTLCKWAFEMGATRVTAFVTSDRIVAKDYVRRVGADYEGTMRAAFRRDEKLLDIEIYGLMKETFVWQPQQL